MTELAIFRSQPNSHPFQERHVLLNEPMKIGRSVARARPAPNNAIFDCKVLSRNHALLWFEDNKFWLQDTRSSNGTFVNSQRLSKGSEESPPMEIYSGDNIQFGVDVMENARRITHGCIICTVSLYYADGREAKRDASQSTTSGPAPNATSREVYQLAQHLQDALQREKHLERKLSELKSVMKEAQTAAESGWQAMIDEDRLLSRIEVLESQLQVYAKHHSEDSLRQELVALQDEKHTYETTAKTSMSKALEEKLEAVRKLHALENSLSGAEHECAELRERCESTHSELQQLAEEYSEKAAEVETLLVQIQEAETQFSSQLEALQLEKAQLQELYDAAVEKQQQAQQKLEDLEAEAQFQRQQLSNLKENIEVLDEENKNSLRIEDIADGSDVKEDTDSESPEPDNLRAKLAEAQAEVARYQSLLEESDNRIRESEQRLVDLEDKLRESTCQLAERGLQMSALEEKLVRTDTELNQLTESALESLKTQTEAMEISPTDAPEEEGSADPAERDDLTERDESTHYDLAKHEDTIERDECAEERTMVPESTLHVQRDAEAAHAQQESAVVALQGDLLLSQEQQKLLQQEIASLQASLQEASARAAESEVKAQSMLEDLNTKENHLRDKDDDIRLLQKRLTEMEEDREEQRHGQAKEEAVKALRQLEAELARSRAQEQASAERCSQLLQSHDQMEAAGAGRESELRQRAADARKELDGCQGELSSSRTALNRLQYRVEELEAEANMYRSELDTSADELASLAHRSRTLSLCSMLPLVLLLLGILTAMSPLLSVLTATDGEPLE